MRPRTDITAGIVLVAAVAATSAGFAQSRLGDDAEQQQIVERIQQEESRNGPYSESLIGPLSDLALIYQDRGDHDLAVAVVHRVRQVVRANEGLHSLEQIPLIQQLIANEEAIGRAESAWEFEQDLLTLVRRHPEDIRAVPVFREAAEKRMAVLRHYLAGEFPPQIALGCYYNWPHAPLQVREGQSMSAGPAPGSCVSGDRDDVIRALVSDAQMNYADAIAALLHNDLYASDELRELELGLLQSIELTRVRRSQNNPNNDLIGARFDLEPWRSWVASMERIVPQPVAWLGVENAEKPEEGEASYHNRYGNGLDYRLGRQSLERSLAYEAAASTPLSDQFEAFVRIADWDLLHTRNALALEQYQRAHKMLEEAGAQTSIAAIFSPKIPVVLPAFVSNPLASDATQASTGYIDVSFEISRYGESRRIEILDTTTNATEAEQTRLVRLIQSSRFRPRVEDGEFAQASPVVLRYYLTE